MNSLIATLHDCPGSPDHWKQFLTQLAGQFDCMFSGFARWTGVKESDISFSTGADESHLRAYHEHFAGVNPWIIEGAAKFTDGVVLPTHALVPDERFARSEFYNDFLAREHLGRCGLAAQIRSGAKTVHLSILRTPNRPAFGDAELRQIKGFVPHIRAAIANDGHVARLRAECAAIKESLDGLPYAVIVLGAHPFINASARRVITTWPDVFAFGDGTISISHPFADAALQRRIEQARHLRQAVDPPFVLRLNSDVAFAISVIAGFRGAQWALNRPPLIVLQAREAPSTVADTLVERHGLTAREAQLALRLRTQTLRDAADDLGVTWQTARTHLARVFLKTGVHSQRELVALADRLTTRR